ncbi:MAG TPA: di-heme oxidoredictase family protein [Candidatus Polarisedimenticolia bacterium]|nr:di-heme oxidoredictase family protein [Candidatus Polarisedimenticolia bacterium]
MKLSKKRWLGPVITATGILLLSGSSALAQLNDKKQTPNSAGEGINKSMHEQEGAGRGDIMTPESSLFIIKRDPFRSIRRGRQLFQRKFTIEQGLGPRTLDGVGDIEQDGSLGAGLGDSCASCHGRPRGSAGFGGDVFTRPDGRDAPHLFGLGLQEMLADEITQELRAIRAAALLAARNGGKPVQRSLVSKGINYGKITAFPDGSVNTSGVIGVNPDLRVRPFFAQGGTISMREFLVGAFNAEMGIEAVDPDLEAAAAGGRVVTPAGMVLDGALDTIEAPMAHGVFDDPDADRVVNELPVSLVDHMEFYLLNYFKPATYRQTRATASGRERFLQVGCGTCHMPDLKIDSDRRVADVETVYDPVRGIFNNLFATAAGRFSETDDHSGQPTLKTPSGQPFVVRNIFADFKRHDLGPAFHERNFNGTMTTQFMTEPLWGVGSTAPYGHDGRSMNLQEVILRHGGEAQQSRDRFVALQDSAKSDLLEFLESLILFPPDDTASNLNPGDRNAPGFPQKGHGSISLTVLFDDPTDLE